MVERTNYEDDFIKEFTEIWERHMANNPTATPKGEWETIDRYVANDNSRVYMRVNRKLGLYMPELIMGSVTESDVRDNEADAVVLFNAYVAKAFSRANSRGNKKGGAK